jgi:hypothetical protein
MLRNNKHLECFAWFCSDLHQSAAPETLMDMALLVSVLAVARILCSRVAVALCVSGRWGT